MCNILIFKVNVKQSVVTFKWFHRILLLVPFWWFKMLLVFVGNRVGELATLAIRWSDIQMVASVF